MNSMCQVFINEQSCCADPLHYWREADVENPRGDQQCWSKDDSDDFFLGGRLIPVNVVHQSIAFRDPENESDERKENGSRNEWEPISFISQKV